MNTDKLLGSDLAQGLAALLLTAFLCACGSSQAPAPHDGSASGSGGNAGTPSGDAADADALHPDAAGEASAGGDVEAGADGAPACVPACGSGKACIDGACLEAPVVLARSPACGAARLALAADVLYWTERATGVVKKLAVADAAATPALVAINQMSPGPITTDETGVYWSNDGDHTVRAGLLDGTFPDAGVSDGHETPLVTAPDIINGLLAISRVLYYSAGASAYKVPLTFGAITTLATFAPCRPSRPAALAAAGDYLFQTDFQLQFITRERIDGTQLGNNPCVAADAGAPQIAVPETVTHSQGSLLLDALYTAGGEVVWADHATVSAKTIAFTTQTTSRPVASSAGSNSITGFVVTGASVYLGEGDDFAGGPAANTIQVAPLAAVEGGADTPTAKVLAPGQSGASSFVADATHVYWVTRTPSPTAGAADDCAIVSLAR